MAEEQKEHVSLRKFKTEEDKRKYLLDLEYMMKQVVAENLDFETAIKLKEELELTQVQYSNTHIFKLYGYKKIMECELKLTFDESAKKDILDFLDKKVDKDNFIVEKNNQKQRVLTEMGEEVSYDEFGGAKKGSEIFIKKDLISLMRLSTS